MTENVDDGTEYGLASRLRFLIGETPTRNFANQVGVKDGTLRSVLKGTRPSIDFVVAVSEATKASLEWLATGRGRPFTEQHAGEIRGFNRELYNMLADCVERVYAEMGVKLGAGAIAATIIDIYDHVIEIAPENDIEEYRALLPWVEYGLRQEGKYHLDKMEGDRS